MTETTVEFNVRCKRCNGIDPATGKTDPKRSVGYSGMMYEKMKEYGYSRPEYCDICKKELQAEKMTMGAAYYAIKMLPEASKEEVIPGELGKVWHPDRPHVKSEKPKTFDESKFGATPGKIVEIYEWLKEPDHQVAIIKGGTGSGKSTALPYWLIYPPTGVPHDFFTRDGQIVITQPRIVATTGVTKFLGTLMGSTVGKGFDIGYRYSKDRNADKFNAAFMATDGTLINMIKQGQLSELSVVMIDEAHERSLNIDIILHLLKEMLPLYPHLKLLIVSATINAEQFLDYFGRETAKLIEFEPKSKFTYEVHFAEESEKIHYEDPNRLKKELVPALVKKVSWLLNEQVDGRKPYGDILAFLQGVKPIDEAVAQVRSFVVANPKLKEVVEVYPLYSALEEAESDKAINPPKTEKPRIRVVIATNVAEASITVEGVVYVVESGVENQAQWEVENSKKSVELRLISKANAKQRFGRSGRTRNGEVFCLYTKTQFEVMRDFPVPAVQRSSMEEIILKMKELGIDDFGENWIDAPVAEELIRSEKILKTNGAIDDDEMLTEYGALLTQFSYPSDLANLIITADLFGCLLEIATILPIIKTGGYRGFLEHETSWDEPTKQRVEKIQSALWSGCKDDVEFILRLYSFWKNPPKLADPKQGETDGLRFRREVFAKTFYVNFGMFEEDIEPEKEKILQLLFGRIKDQRKRDLQFDLIERVRTVLALCLPCDLVEGEYLFSSRVSNETNAVASCKLALSTERYAAIKTLAKEKASPLKVTMSLLKESDETPEETANRLLTTPTVPEEETKSFADFTSRFVWGQELTVMVTGYVEHSGDFRVSLAVRESTTGYETWLTPADLNFTQSSAVIKQIPVGTKLRVMVKEINPEKNFVKLFCLPLLEAELEKTYKLQKKIDGQIITKAKVIDVRTDNKIIFAAELSRPEEGFILVVHANERALEKAPASYKVGEVCLVSFRLETGFDYKANLAGVSEKLQSYLKQTDSCLSWSDGKLSFKGKMKYADLQELAKIDDTNAAYLAALEYIYLSSNMNWASKVRDTQWLEAVKSKFAIGQVLEVTAGKILSVGVLADLKDGTTGFVRLMKGNETVKEGESLKVKVTGFNEERQQVDLCLDVPAIDPRTDFVQGKVLQGVVDNLVNYGAFVNLGQGYSGLIHTSKMGRRVNDPSEVLAKGDKVEVKVLDCREEKGRWKISLSLLAVIK